MEVKLVEVRCTFALSMEFRCDKLIFLVQSKPVFHLWSGTQNTTTTNNFYRYLTVDIYLIRINLYNLKQNLEAFLLFRIN